MVFRHLAARPARVDSHQTRTLTVADAEKLDAEDWEVVVAIMVRASREAATVTVPSSVLQRLLTERRTALQKERRREADVLRLQIENEDLANALARYRSREDDQSFFDFSGR